MTEVLNGLISMAGGLSFYAGVIGLIVWLAGAD